MEQQLRRRGRRVHGELRSRPLLLEALLAVAAHLLLANLAALAGLVGIRRHGISLISPGI